jgi:hypothetical protein
VSDGRVITRDEWVAQLSRWPNGEVPPYFTLDGRGPGYFTSADLVTVQIVPEEVK